MNCASDFPISFHYVTPVEMYRLEYLLYRVKIFQPAEEIEQKPQIMWYSYCKGLFKHCPLILQSCQSSFVPTNDPVINGHVILEMALILFLVLWYKQYIVVNVPMFRKSALIYNPLVCIFTVQISMVPINKTLNQIWGLNTLLDVRS